MRLYSYVVKHDTGFAPNPFFGYCTVACCKSEIRLKAEKGHWIVGLTPKAKGIRQMKRKWASMSTVGRLTLDAQLLRLPKELGEFVIVHELVHLLAPNHGRVFKSFMLAYLPDWEEREQRLQTQHAKSLVKGRCC